MPRFPDHSRRAETVCGSPLEAMAPLIAKLKDEGRLYPFQLGDSYLLPPEKARRIDLDEEILHRYHVVENVGQPRHHGTRNQGQPRRSASPAKSATPTSDLSTSFQHLVSLFKY